VRSIPPIPLLVLGCAAITGDFGTVVAIEYHGSLTPSVEEGDTIRLTAVALDLDGNPLPEVPVVWRVLEPDTTVVGFTLDSLTGFIAAASSGGPWRVQGSAEDLRMGTPVKVTVTAAPDSVSGVEPTRVTVAVEADSSPPLIAVVYDLTTEPGAAKELGGKRVEFRLVDPAPGSPAAASVALAAPNDTSTTADPHVVALLSRSNGQAIVTARRVSGLAQPDSILVDAFAFTARGDTVMGSPVRFVVLFPLN
jgi:hypothetical protein